MYQAGAWRIQREGADSAQMQPAMDPFMSVQANEAEDDGGDLPF